MKHKKTNSSSLYGKELLKEANAGDPNAMWEVAFNCGLGSSGFEKDKRAAFMWYERAAAEGHARSIFSLANCYLRGNGTKGNKKHEQIALELYLKAEQLELDEIFRKELYESVGDIYCSRNEYEKAIEYYEKCCALDGWDYFAHHHLAYLYEKGMGTERNIILAIKNYYFSTRAINEKGSASDASNIARLFEEIDVDAEAAKSDENKKILGNAAYYIGSWYFDGSREIPRHDEGVKWLTLAAKFDNIDAHYLLGTAYENGDGIDQNIRRAAEHYEKAASAEHADAQLALARCYLSGDDPDDAECKANDLDGALRKNNIIKNPELAKEWLKRAAANGSSEAKKMLEVL